MRTAVALVLAASVVGTLAACSPTAPTLEEGCVAPGSTSDGVDVSGDFGAEPDVTFDAPLTLESTQRTVAIDGDGDTVAADDIILVDFAVYNGSTGVKIETTGFNETGRIELTVNDASILPGFVKAYVCSDVGSRIVSVIAAADAFGEAGAAQLSVGPNETILLVTDVIEILPPAPLAPTEEYEGSEGLPLVEFDAAGVPVVTIPDTPAPAELRIAIIEEGDGAVLGASDEATVHYQGTNWETKQIFDSSWERGAPATFNLQQVVAGFTQALVGRTIGTTLVVSIPPELGYGPQGGNPDAGIGATDTLVFVITVLEPAAG